MKRFLTDLLIILTVLTWNIKLNAQDEECARRINISLCIGIDVSPSMLEPTNSPKLNEARAFAISVISELGNTGYLNEVRLFTFCATRNIDTQWITPATAINRLSGNFTSCDGTGIRNAIVYGTNRLTSRSTSNLKLLIVLTDGEETEGNYTVPQTIAILSNSGIRSRLIFIGGNPGELQTIANGAGSSSQALSATPGNLNSLVDEMVDATCLNFRPIASFTMSDNNLSLGVEGFSIVFDGRGSSDREDSDSQLDFRWTFTRPGGSTFVRSGATRTETFNDDYLSSGTNWSVRLVVQDTDGASDSETANFSVTGSPPVIEIVGPDRIDALEPLTLEARNTLGSDPAGDVDGGNIEEFSWTIQDGPTEGSVPIGNVWATRIISWPNPATEADITTLTDDTDIVDRPPWKFVCKATDDEGDTGEETKIVRVYNLPPIINLIGDTEIDTGDELRIETGITKDDDGGDLIFSWDLIQSPNSSSYRPVEDFGIDSVLVFVTDETDAGTWIFQLNATDNEGETVSEQFTVVVDGLPIAIIEGSATIGTLSSLELDGSNSIDPDSPCDPPDYCHTTTDPQGVKGISRPIVGYTWSIATADVNEPLGFLGPLYEGRLDEGLLNMDPYSPSISITTGLLDPGDYTFQLDVEDGEDNNASEFLIVSVIQEEAPPVAIVNPPLSILTDLSGTILSPQNTTLSGFNSYDKDNLLDGGLLGPGLGITNYQWSYLAFPSGCPPLLLPPLPSGPSLHTFNLFYPGNTVSPECLGRYELQLTVTDDDATPKTSSATTSVIIYNCPNDICINSPTTANPEFVEFTENTDILIDYYLSSMLYEDPLFLAGGLVAELEIFHESDGLTPVFSSRDPNLLASDKGSVLRFHWNGYDNDGYRPENGRYDVWISLLDHQLSTTTFIAEEKEAIVMEVVEPEILPTTTQYIDFDDLTFGTPVTIDYDFSMIGHEPDALVWRVYDEASAVVKEETVFPPYSGTILWDGQLDASNLIAPAGHYQLELETLRGVAVLGRSNLHDLTIYRIQISSPAGALSSTSPGLHVLVNSDDDNQNNISDLNESVPGEDDLIPFDILIEPSNLEGEFTISATNPANLKVWDNANKANEITLPATTNMPANVPPVTIFVEGRTPGETNLNFSFTTIDGIALSYDDAVLTFVELQIMEDINNNFSIDAGDNAKLFVRVGLWDNAFRRVADPFGVVGTLYNQQDDARIAATGNPENFIGRDSRRFYFRIQNPSANSDPAVTEEIPLGSFDWYTLKSDGTDDDRPRNNASLSLIETGANTGVFLSPAVMCVVDTIDRNQPTNTGMAAHAGLANYNQANHRSREVSSPDGSVECKYLPTGAGGQELKLKLPVFRRNPEFRRVMTVRAFNFADPLNTGIAGIPQALIDDHLSIIEDLYVPAGVRVETSYDPATNSLNLPMGSTINLNNIAGFTGSYGTLAPSLDQASLISLVRAIEPATPANVNTIFVLFIGQFMGGDHGQSFPDGWLPGGSMANNFVFVAGSHPTLDPTTAAHEVGHLLYNETLTASEASGAAPGWAGGGHYGGPQTPFNLMSAGVIQATYGQIDAMKRLWDDTAIHLIRQITRFRRSRFLRNP